MIRKSNNIVIFTGSSQDPRRQLIPTPEDELAPSIINVSQLMHEEHEYVQVTMNKIVEGLRNGSIKVVSDASFDREQQLGTAAWTIATTRFSYLVGTHWTPGEAPTQCAHCSELSGNLGAIMHVNKICTLHILHPGKLNSNVMAREQLMW